MSIHEILFCDYLKYLDDYNLHPDLKPVWINYTKYFMEHPKNVKHIMVHGPKGVGKYTQVLYFLKQLSPTKLMYDRKLTIPNQKQECIIRMSDIHCELDFGVLGCNAKTNWSDLYQHILDLANSSLNKIRFVVCLNIWSIHPELLDVLYFYMRHNYNVSLSFIIISDSISFLSREIYNICEYIWIKRPSKSKYQTIVTQNIKDLKTQEILNMSRYNNRLKLHTNYYKPLCEPIIAFILNPSKSDFFSLRDNVYNLSIFHININEALLYIIHQVYVLCDTTGKKDKITKYLIDFYEKFYNNYRSIYHLESILINVTKILHESS